mmetsp:Transcript_27356/g.27590  ORF Transcript_27356/g.27590 Transcript_27356/m.27590 type:complete len:111 (+) Transcript_27356:144-476(+)|eukprot:CAMPEP_0182421440 /NCGR_PEP_ID=MMETSP1167-20130531/6849_1 /TAXON_ID=2988 /ORGANISM="Mallomonas Sp, Strain CCMP3275" /LENGTH=110 /DNA_ID=CAMNT_0024598603 /DNA_START=102 /DNA_END=434 /DNA_ORIENTATION=-
MSKKESPFSPADIKKAAGSLHATDIPSESKLSAKATEAENAETMDTLEKLYRKYDGDLDSIFEELDANPEKAKKPHNRPRDAHEFALKFIQGFYNLVEDEDIAEEKKSRK